MILKPIPYWKKTFEKEQETNDTDARKYSSLVVGGADKAPNRSMLRAVDFKYGDFKKPVIGISSTWSMVTPCNMHIDKLAHHLRSAGRTNPIQSDAYRTTYSSGIERNI